MALPFPFSPATSDLIDLAIREDLFAGDVTTDAIFTPEEETRGAFAAKQELVVSGKALVDEVYRRIDPDIRIEWFVEDGDRVGKGTIAISEGRCRSLLRAERVALNFLRHLSGIATLTDSYVQALGGRQGPRLLDTRKTTPGFRELEKYAVRCGGGHNHRFNLGSGAMIKDNHIAAAGSIELAIDKVRHSLPWLNKIEVEVSNFDELRQAIEHGADVILLDNMSTEDMKEAIRIGAGRVLLEASGNITLERLPELSNIGLDAVSSGALTHSAPNSDISYVFGRVPERAQILK